MTRSPRHSAPPSLPARLGWLILIWLCSIAVLGAVASLIRFWLKA